MMDRRHNFVGIGKLLAQSGTGADRANMAGNKHKPGKCVGVHVRTNEELNSRVRLRGGAMHG